MLGKRFRRLGVWMIANKDTSTPLNPKSKMQNQGGEDQVQEHYLVLLVKMQESRSFDMFFFGVFFGCLFGIWKREKKHVERLGRRKILGKKMSPWSGACLGLFITPSANFEATALEGLPASKALKKCGFGYLWKDFGFQILKRHGT